MCAIAGAIALKRTCILGLICLVGLSRAEASEPVMVTAKQQGQGVLRANRDQCLLVAPDHVLGTGYAITLTDRHRVLAEADRLTTIGPDLGIARVRPGPQLDCFAPRPIQDLGEVLDTAVMRQSLGTLLRVRETGGIETFAVRFSGLDQHYVHVTPTTPGVTLQKGISGSQLLLEGDPVGMVQTIDSVANSISAYRFDALQHLLSYSYPQPESTDETPSVRKIDKDGASAPNTLVIATTRTAIREQPDRWSHVIRWLETGEATRVQGKVQGIPWLMTADGYIYQGDVITR